MRGIVLVPCTSVKEVEKIVVQSFNEITFAACIILNF